MKKYGVIIFLISIFLMGLGIYLVMSASNTYSDVRYDQPFKIFSEHLRNAGLGLLFLIVFAVMPYRYLKPISKAVLFTAILLLLLTLLIGQEINGAKRWLNLGIQFQTSDFARLALIIHLASFIERKGEAFQEFSQGFFKAFIWVVAVVVLVMAQPNVSTSFLLLMLSFILMYVGGAKKRHILLTSFTSFGLLLMSALMLSHSRERLEAFVTSLSEKKQVSTQVYQAIVGLGSGGPWGVGFGESKQRNLFISEAHNDFIFAIWGEERGFAGTSTILAIYFTMFYLGFLISRKAPDVFGQLLAFGISMSFIMMAFINAAVASGAIPATGLPLPFVSSGGTSILILSISTGILINIAFAAAKLEKSEPEIIIAKAN